MKLLKLGESWDHKHVITLMRYTTYQVLSYSPWRGHPVELKRTSTRNIKNIDRFWELTDEELETMILPRII